MEDAELIAVAQLDVAPTVAPVSFKFAAILRGTSDATLCGPASLFPALGYA